MKYLISRNNPASQFVQLQLSLICQKDEKISLTLPSWRPGRYEITDYAQKIRGFKISFLNKNIPSKKISKNRWEFHAPQEGLYSISYEFHASQMDAGGSWSDDQQLYLNFINCIYSISGRETMPIAIDFELPAEMEIATALPRTAPHQFTARDFQHLVDSPVIASSHLQHYSYQVANSNFHLWFLGEIHFDVPTLINQFEAFTKRQIEAFGEFPSTDYHFLYQLLPYKHYHGVEHQHSTVITFGPAKSLSQKDQIDELFGVSCHELYHFWNVCRIRPVEMLPYDFSKEVYFDTGFVAEGVTTYLGDLYLLKSGYFSLRDYLKNMEAQLQREFEAYGWQNYSIAESSFDLWLDGYKQGIPDRKVSIYNRGALLAITLDLMLLEQGSSLEQVMKSMWENYGKVNQGYSMEDFKQIVSKAYRDDRTIDQFFDKFIYGTDDILPQLCTGLDSLNISLKIQAHPDRWASSYGLKISAEGQVLKIHPQSPAYRLLMQGDIITTVNGEALSEATAVSEDLSMEVLRYGRHIQLQLPTSSEVYYHEYLLIDGPINEKRALWQK